MIVPDINLLLYAYDSTSPFHSKAVPWLEACLSGAETVGFAPVVLFGFARIATHSRVFHRPMTATEATGHIRSWLAQPCSRVLETHTEHIEQTIELLNAVGVAGNLVTNAQIAALVIEHEAVLHTADADFLRFPRVRWFNPITGAVSGRSARPKSND